jgi:tRNA A37 threonylcarbamoyladenosine synthetase subunit TsaC/SUA5/YrdC
VPLPADVVSRPSDFGIPIGNRKADRVGSLFRSGVYNRSTRHAEVALSVQVLFIDRPDDRARAARALRAGHVVATAFGNFYAIVAAPSAAIVRSVNLAKGRPADQIGSITTAAENVTAVFDWAQVSPLLDGSRLRSFMAALAQAGPIGFRGPAMPHLPDHLTQMDQAVRTTQVISPGTACASNAFLRHAAAELDLGYLYVTSANRSHHLTGASEEPAHWSAAGIVADFAHLSDLIVIEHRDEAAAREAYPRHLPMSVTLLSFHRPIRADDPLPQLTVDRHGSLHIDDVRGIAAQFGFSVRLGVSASNRLSMRSYVSVPI